MVKKARRATMLNGCVDVACVIHGSGYDWRYVENLHRMLQEHVSASVRFHVFTEHDRSVPGHMIKHILTEWPNISGPKKSWWYKMQLFDPRHMQGRLLYLDLDTVIVRNIDWLWESDPQHFWSIQDFRHLWKPSWQGMNSSVMLWDTLRFGHIWSDFAEKNINAVIKQFHGDQDYLNSVVHRKNLRFFDNARIQSWRWQVLDGGLDMKTRQYQQPGGGARLADDTSIVVFHGHPKPHEIQDDLIRRFWCGNLEK